MDTPHQPHESTYGWIVTKDPDTTPDDELYRVGTMGPRNIPAGLKRRPEAGQGRIWRTLYDDHGPAHERVVHVGRYLDYDDLATAEGANADYPEVDSDAEAGPLRDLSGPDCGASDIQYKNSKGAWVTL